MIHARSRCSFALVALSLSACTAGKVFIASSGDYSAYRETRVAATDEARLAASGRYLHDYPHGAYVDEVKADFSDREAAYFRACGDDIDKLERYVQYFPDGPHAKDAQIAIDLHFRRATKVDESDRVATATRDRLDAFRDQRRRAQSLLGDWFERAIDPAVFASPLGDGPAAFVVPFVLSLPAPRCSRDEHDHRTCIKLAEATFSFPRDKVFVEHEILFDVKVDMDDRGAPATIRIAGPELFSRFDETFIEERAPADETDRRIGAIERTIEVLTSVFDAHVSNDPACTIHKLEAGEVVHLACHGVDLLAVAGRSAGDDDEIFVRSRP